MRTARLAALALLLLVAAAVPRPAGAVTTKTFGAGPFRYVVETASIPAGGTTVFSANCPSGFHGTGAGAKIFAPPPAQSPGNMWITGAEPSVSLASGSARNVTGSGERFNGTAICLADPASILTYPTSTSTTSANGTVVNLIAQCGSGKQIAGGGGSSSQPDETSDVASFPRQFAATPGDIGWHFDATHLGTTSTTMLARAVCIPVSMRTIKSVFGERVLDGGATKSVNAKCPSRFHVSAGGAEIPYGDLIASAPFDSADADKAPDDGWSIDVRNRTPTAEVERAWAVCVK